MIDIHNHILPQVDDGVDSEVASFNLLLEAAKDGISDVCITPHFSRIDDYLVYKDELLKKFNHLKKRCSNLDINLYLGNELMIEEKLDQLLLEDKVCTLNNSNYVLIELPMNEYKYIYDEYLMNVSLSGYRIIIAHPERYRYVQNDNDFVYRWINSGYYLQINQNSLFNLKTKRTVYKLIDKRLVSLVASDAHSINRPLALKDAYVAICKRYSEETAEILFNRNPYYVLTNKNIVKTPNHKKRLFAL